MPCTNEQDFARRFSFTEVIIHRGLSGHQIIFSDEKLFTTNDLHGRTMWVQSGRAPLPRENARWPVKLMVWGAIGHDFRILKILFNKKDKEGFRLTTETYKRKVLQGGVMQALEAQGNVFMQDGAAAHTSKATLDYLRRKNITVLDGWPARSPDLNPMERLWAIMQPRVSAHCPRTIDDLAAAVQTECDRLPSRPSTRVSTSSR